MFLLIGNVIYTCCCLALTRIPWAFGQYIPHVVLNGCIAEGSGKLDTERMHEWEQTEDWAYKLHSVLLAESQWLPKAEKHMSFLANCLPTVRKFGLSEQCSCKLVYHPKGIIRMLYVLERDHWFLWSHGAHPFTAGELLCCEIEFQLDMKLISFHSSNFWLRHCVSVFGTCCVWAWKPTLCVCVASWHYHLPIKCHGEQGDWGDDSFSSAILWLFITA